MRRARLLPAAGLLLACAAQGAQAPEEPPGVSLSNPDQESTEAAPTVPSVPPTPPPAPPPAEPDRTQPPWSQTVVAPVADGAVERGTRAEGRRLRLGTSRGAVHVWLPRGYAPRTAGVVVYVHGYFTSVDQAFVDHRLAEQFRDSGRNALFVAAEAPSWNGEGVAWPGLAELLGEVAARAQLGLPQGPVVVAGHSGAIRTVLPWLVHPRVEEILLLDGLYRGEDELAAWLGGAPAGRRRLLLVGQETARRTEAWLPSVPGARFHPALPDRAVTARDRRAAVVYWRSQLDHMALVERGTVLPMLLRATRLGGL
ncbi:MAG: hypothetical protein QM767_22480 [Anaeromyxobacter sp.]